MIYVKFLVLLFCSCIAQNIYSQKTINGTVTDERNSPVTNAIILHIDTVPGRIIENKVVNETGYFSINNVKFGREKLKITAIGYKETDILSDTSGANINIVLHPLSYALDDVIIQGKSAVVQKNDRLIFNIANSNITKGNNTYDLLRFTPLVTVQDEKIGILGKNALLLYINGRNSHLSGGEIQKYLQSLPAEQIASIEVIANPTSVYKTSGSEGIINLILKKSESDGIKGTITINESVKTTNSLDGSSYLYYQKNKLNLSTNVYGGNDRYYTKTKAEYSYYDIGKQHIIENTNDPNNIKIGANIIADYKLSKKQTLGVMLNGIIQKRMDEGIAKTHYYKLNATTPDSIVTSNNNVRTPSYMFSSNLNYRLETDDKGSKLSFDFDYLRNYKDAKTYLDFTNENNLNALTDHSKVTQQSNDVLNSYIGKIEYSHIPNKKNNLTTGIELFYLNSKMDYFHGNYDNGQWESDLQKSNIFKYNENYLSGFVTYNRIWSNKINTTIGVRMEYDYLEGDQATGTSSRIKQNHFDVLPSLALMYTINPNHRLTLNAMSSVARPPINYFNPFRFYQTPTTYIENNPYLKPARLNLISANYVLKRHYIFSINYVRISDCINIFKVPEAGGFTKIKRVNFGNADQLFSLLAWNDSFWNNRVYVNASVKGTYAVYKGNVESMIIDVQDFNYNLSLAAGAQISKKYDWNITTNYTYRSKNKLAQENNNAYNRLDIEAKKVFANNISLNFGVRSIFSSKMDYYKTFDNYSYNLLNLQNNRTVYVRISIPFGNKKIKGVQSRETSTSTITKRINAE